MRLSCLFSRGCSCICFWPWLLVPSCLYFLLGASGRSRNRAPEPGPAGRWGWGLGGGRRSLRSCLGQALSQFAHASVCWDFSHPSPLPGDLLLALQAGCPRLELPVACQAPLTVGILQAGILEGVAMPSSRGSSPPRIKRTSLRSPALTGWCLASLCTMWDLSSPTPD